MELVEAIKKQLHEEIGEDVLSKSETLILNQKFGLTETNLSEDEAFYSLPEFLKVKEFAVKMEGSSFKRAYWRRKWIQSKIAVKRLLERQQSKQRRPWQNKRQQRPSNFTMKQDNRTQIAR